MASNSLASSSSSSSANLGAAPRRRARADSETDVLRELVKVVCECLYRTRSGPRAAGNEPKRKTKWFGIVSDRVQEVETQLAEWNPYLTTIVNVSLDSVLVESWSIRYTPNASEPQKRVYQKLMVFVRSLLVVAQALPASRSRVKSEIRIRLAETDHEPYDVVPTLPEQYCFPSVDLSYGRVDVQVRYVADLIPTESTQESVRRIDSQTRLEPSIVEDYIAGPRSYDDGSHVDDDDEGSESRRWRRWASERFEEREKELAERSRVEDPRRTRSISHQEDEEEDEDDEEIPGPPSNTRASSNPMDIPGKKQDDGNPSTKRSQAQRGDSFGSSRRNVRRYRSGSRGSNPSPLPDDAQFALSSAPVIRGSGLGRRSSNNFENQGTFGSSVGNVARRASSFRLSSHPRTSNDEGRPSTSFGYSVADLIASSTNGTPILTSLPFAVGSLTSSITSIQELASSKVTTPGNVNEATLMRTRFLQSGDGPMSSSPPFPLGTMSAGSLMISRHNSALALLENNIPSPSPQLPTVLTTPPPAQRTFQMYDAALPWVLTKAEMEKPFATLAGSVTLGTTFDDENANHSSSSQKQRENGCDDVGDSLNLPFFVDEEHESDAEDECELGAFVRRCKDAKDILESSKTINVEDLQSQLDSLVKQTGLDKMMQPQEVVTIYEERPL